MKRKKIKKLLALFLVFGMMLSLLPNMAFAAEVSDGEYPSATCTVTEGCTLEDGHDGECVTVPTEDSTDGEGNDNIQDSSVPADTESEEETEYLAEPLAANGAYTVKVYATVSGMKFSDGENEVAAETTADGEYIVYTLSVDAGTYTYSAQDYGTGTLKVTESADIYLRVVNYTLNKDPEVGFKMRVVNTTDDELVYISDVTTSPTASLLIPAYGYNIRYQYHFEPVDEAYCSFYGNLWVERGTTAFEGFKQTRFNLSDGRQYWMSKGSRPHSKYRQEPPLKWRNFANFTARTMSMR